MLGIVINLIVIASATIVVLVISAIVVGSKYEKEFMTSWEKCNGNCSSCKDAGQCMNRPYK